MIDVSFFVRLDDAKIQSHPLADWRHQIALDTDTEIETWQDVYQFVARAWLSGGDYDEYVQTHGVDVERDGDPDLGTDVKAPEVLEEYDRMR